MPSKIADVARHAGVSTATVSRTLSVPDMVRPETRQRVMAAVAALDYTPNAAARNLRSGSTNTVLVVLPKLANGFFGEVVRGVEAELAREGYGLIVSDLDDVEEREQHVMRLAAAGHVDGVLLFSGRMPRSGGRSLADLGLPVVAANARIDHPGVPNVLVDERPATAAQVRHLHGLGHRRIGYLAALPGNVNDVPRWAGFLDGLAEVGLPAEQALRFEGDYSFASGARSAAAFLAMPPDERPTGLASGSDEMAIAFMNRIRAAGVRVPEEVSVIGFDGIEFGAYCEPGLTTMRQPQRPLGVAAARKLLEGLDGAPAFRRDVELRTELVLRGSTAPPVRA